MSILKECEKCKSKGRYAQAANDKICARCKVSADNQKNTDQDDNGNQDS